MNDSPWLCGGKPEMRGHRMGTWQRDREDDLALFHNMRARERDNFLHPSTHDDDIEASLPTRFGGLSGYRVAASSPMRTDSADLLMLDPEKNDYNWLLTPPGTPLFPSLDQDVPIINLSQRRALTRSVSASKTSRLSYTQDSSPRPNPSPRRLSTASSPTRTTHHRARPSSPSLANSSPALRPSTPSRRPATPSRRASTTASRTTSRSSTPTLQRTNTSPVTRSFSATKPGSTNRRRGNSLSPSLRPWESGVSTEQPPNLRTFCSDRSPPRGGSLRPKDVGTAGNSYLEACESNRPRTSPNVSRGGSLSNSHDHNSSQTSKGSTIFSRDDDLENADSLEAGNTRSSYNMISKAVQIAARKENPSEGRCILPAKRQTRSTTASRDATMSVQTLASKRSFERQADQRRSSQSMFRPLLSSVPAASFYSCRPAGMHHMSTSPVLESSLTISSSNEITENGTRILPKNNKSHADEGEEDCAREGVFDGDEDQLSELRRQETKSNRVEEGSSIVEEPKELVQNHAKAGAAKERIDPCNGNQVFVDDSEIKKQSFLATHRHSINTVQCSEESPDKSSLEEGSSITPLICKAQNFQPKNHASSIFSFQRNALQVQETQSARYTEPKDMQGEDTVGQESRIDFLRETLESKGFKDGKCAVNVDLKIVESRSQGHQEGTCLSACTTQARLTSQDTRHSTLNSGNNQMETVMVAHPRCLLEGAEPAFHSEFRASDSSVIDRLSKSNQFDEKPSLYKGKDVSMERKEMLQGVTDSKDVMDSNLHLLLSPKDSTEPEHNSQESPEISMEDSPKNGTLPCELNSNILSNSADSLSQKDVLSILGLSGTRSVSEEDNVNLDTTVNQRGDMETVTETLAGLENSEDNEPFLNSTCGEQVVEDTRFLEDFPKKQQPAAPLLKRNVTLEEATNTILFCNSIVHGIVYKAAEIALQKEEHAAAGYYGRKKELVTLFGLSGAGHRSASCGQAVRKQKPAGFYARETFRYVQKQRMIHQRTPAVTLQQSLMDRTESAVIGTHEEYLTKKTTKLDQKKTREVKCRCSCHIM